ncbi:MAG: PepSY domain-containing protein [Gemmatimonadetes bacterium]|nr:PepSY domain-containing protein [Gemmatimonadota bacterium]
MRKLMIMLAAALFAAPAAAAAQRASHPAHETQAQLAREARVTMAQARSTALAAVPRGRVRSSELEREHGHLIYSFDIAVPGRSGIEEINVDAMTGRILAHEHEGAAAERAEAAQEAKEHRAHPAHPAHPAGHP